jgi:DNA-nicking Smr family endonuclease
VKRRPKSPPADEVHRAMLEHLASHPPPKRKSVGAEPARPKRRARTEHRTPTPEMPARPRLMLRMLRLTPALEKLDAFVRHHRARGTSEIVVVVGRGKRSGEQGPVIGPAVRRWCDEHPALVADWSVAPPSEGGEGALLIRLAGRD